MSPKSFRREAFCPFLLIALMALPIAPLAAQRFRYPEELKTALDDLRSEKREGLFRRAFMPASNESDGLGLLPAETFISYNSAFPAGDGDGSLWQGRGISGRASAGLSYSWNWGRLAIAPEWWGAQNSEFSRMFPATGGDFRDYWGSLDRLQAYGDNTFGAWGLGDTELRVSSWGFTAGIGSSPYRLGPAEIQNLLLSGNAGGFPLADLGTDGPIQTPAGPVEIRLFWGQTRQSSWFNDSEADDALLLAGGVLGWEPSFLPGMSFGFQRLFHSPWSTINAWKLTQFFNDALFKLSRKYFQGGEGNEDDVDQILSLTWEWKIPSLGSRAYIEWGRNDHSANIEDFLMQPDHSQGLVAGLQQEIEIGSWGRFLLFGELADIGNTIGTIVRPTGSWYRHLSGGFTHAGQLLGAPMGPGSNAQEAAIYFLGKGWFTGLSLNRLLLDADYFYTLSHPTESPYLLYNLQVGVTARGGVSTPWGEIGAAVGYIDNKNRDFVPGNNRSTWHVELSGKIRRQ